MLRKLGSGVLDRKVVVSLFPLCDRRSVTNPLSSLRRCWRSGRLLTQASSIIAGRREDEIGSDGHFRLVGWRCCSSLVVYLTSTYSSSAVSYSSSAVSLNLEEGRDSREFRRRRLASFSLFPHAPQRAYKPKDGLQGSSLHPRHLLSSPLPSSCSVQDHPCPRFAPQLSRLPGSALPRTEELPSTLQHFAPEFCGAAEPRGRRRHADGEHLRRRTREEARRRFGGARGGSDCSCKGGEARYVCACYHLRRGADAAALRSCGRPRR